MKELKRLSLKKEVDREAERIEKEVTAREDLEEIKVSEDMETSLFNKIQDYEYEKRAKRVYRRKRKRYIIVALAAVLVLVFGSAITSVGSKSYWKVLWDRMVGDERATHIDVEKMESQETNDIDEIQVYKEVSDKLGISPVRLGYTPIEMYLTEYELDQDQKKAVLLYAFNEQIIKYTMYMNDTDSSFGQIELDKITDQYEIQTPQGITIQVKEYRIDDEKPYRYIAEFQYMDAQYELKGEMDKEEFDKILENLTFYKNIA